MTHSLPNAEAATAPRRESRGWKVVLFVFLGAAVLVPLLLAGRASQEEVDLATLQRRRATFWAVGTFRLNPPSWQYLNAWPRPAALAHLPPPFDQPQAETPAAYLEALALPEQPEPRWVTSRYRMTVMGLPLENTRTVNQAEAAVLDAMLVAAAVLNPAEEEDRACWLRFTASISDSTAVGSARMIAVGSHGGKPRRPPTLGEMRAAEFLHDFLELLSATEDPDERAAGARTLLCGTEASASDAQRLPLATAAPPG